MDSQGDPRSDLRSDLCTDARSDAVLIKAVRGGDLDAYGVLYQRHLSTTQRAASGWAATHTEREDVIAEAFTRVLRALRVGHGPDERFGPYLVATIRNAVISWRRHDSAVSLVADVPEPPRSRTATETDPTGERVHTAVAVDAFATLPERWRVVLWHTEIADTAPTQIAHLLGLTPNSVAALAYRARAGLRKAYLAQTG